MISASFIFNKAEFDDEYYQLDEQIAQAAKATSGYIGEESWENPQSGKVCTVYYWEGREGLRELMANADHLKAKSASSRWLAGYQVVVSEVLATYGTQGYEHILNGRGFDNSGLRSPLGPQAPAST